tara:strand:- start:65 stop:217 length:153 start_codon:yes stop_codon:yes gene_type:complete
MVFKKEKTRLLASLKGIGLWFSSPFYPSNSNVKPYKTSVGTKNKNIPLQI